MAIQRKNSKKKTSTKASKGGASSARSRAGLKSAGVKRRKATTSARSKKRGVVQMRSAA